MKKPTGKSGPYTAKVTLAGDVIGAFEKISFPKDKDNIEEYIVSCFIYSGVKKFGEYFPISNPHKNKLDDFDFSITTPKGEAYLELMEVAPLELYKGGFESATNMIDRYDIAEFAHSKILSKSDKYPDKLSNDLILLLYTTDYKFFMSETSLHILSYFCHKSSLKFDVIFMYTPLDEKEGVVNWIYPSDEEDFENFDPEQYRGEVINLDPEKFEVVSNISPNNTPKRTE